MSDKKTSLIELDVTETQKSISENFGYTNQEIAVIQNSVAKGTNKVELAYFINVCKTVGLNPFIKEIWCYKDNRDNLLVFAGRDGFLAKAQRDKNFAGIRSSEVRQNDVFKIDIANNKITHEFGIDERGEIVGAYAIVFRKGGEPTIEYVDFKTYNKGWNAWKTHPSEMIKKVAETHALKKGFGISGIQSEYDFQEKNNIVNPIQTEKPKNNPQMEDILIAINDADTIEDLDKINADLIRNNLGTEDLLKIIKDKKDFLK